MIRESIDICGEPEEVYRAFSDLKNWRKVLPDVLDVKVLYDDGEHQEFLMTVIRPAGPETVRGVRYCRDNRTIELFQPKPPPKFQRMVGVWKFEPGKDSVTVTAERSFELEPGEFIDAEVTQLVGEKLRGFLRGNLQLFKQSLEKPHANVLCDAAL